MFDLAGDDAIQFGLGEPDFQPPAIAIKAFSKAMEDGRNKYTTTAGLPELRKKIAQTWINKKKINKTFDHIGFIELVFARIDG